MDSFILPDGSVAESTNDIDKYLKRANMAVASDYSKEYLANIRYKKERAEKDERFLDFIREYKKRIWINDLK